MGWYNFSNYLIRVSHYQIGHTPNSNFGHKNQPRSEKNSTSEPIQPQQELSSIWVVGVSDPEARLCGFLDENQFFGLARVGPPEVLLVISEIGFGGPVRCPIVFRRYCVFMENSERVVKAEPRLLFPTLFTFRGFLTIAYWKFLSTNCSLNFRQLASFPERIAVVLHARSCTIICVGSSRVLAENAPTRTKIARSPPTHGRIYRETIRRTRI